MDYVMGNTEVKERVKRMRVGDKIDSNHHPVEVWIRSEEERERGEREGVDGGGMGRGRKR